jgi:hypothetical protein
MARLDGLTDSDAGVLARAIFNGAKRLVGQVPEPLRIMAHNTWVMNANTGFEFAFGRAKAVDAGLKGLASVKAASMVGCVF